MITAERMEELYIIGHEINGRKKGIEEGIAIGEIKGKIEAFLDFGLSIDSIAERLTLTKDEVLKVCKENSIVVNNQNL